MNGPRRRAIVWRGLDAFRAEYADIHLHANRLLASGSQIGTEPTAYEARYSLDTREGYRTARLTVDVTGEGWSRRLDLRRDDESRWELSVDAAGDPGLSDPGGDPASLEGALDCDLAFSPLTNAMPVLRDALHRGGSAREYDMAWVSLPDLAVHRSPQRYEPVAPGRVRFVSLDGDFRAALEFDQDGLIVHYEHLAERVSG